jgi:hypothetical protein
VQFHRWGAFTPHRDGVPAWLVGCSLNTHDADSDTTAPPAAPASSVHRLDGTLIDDKHARRAKRERWPGGIRVSVERVRWLIGMCGDRSLTALASTRTVRSAS